MLNSITNLPITINSEVLSLNNFTSLFDVNNKNLYFLARNNTLTYNSRHSVSKGEYVYYYKAEIDENGKKIYKRTLTNTMEEDKYINDLEYVDINFAKTYGTFLSDFIREFSSSTAAFKVMRYFYRLSQHKRDNSISFRYKELVKETGVSRNIAARLIQKFRKSNYVRLEISSKKKYYINPDFIFNGSSERRVKALSKYQNIKDNLQNEQEIDELTYSNKYHGIGPCHNFATVEIEVNNDTQKFSEIPVFEMNDTAKKDSYFIKDNVIKKVVREDYNFYKIWVEILFAALADISLKPTARIIISYLIEHREYKTNIIKESKSILHNQMKSLYKIDNVCFYTALRSLMEKDIIRATREGFMFNPSICYNSICPVRVKAMQCFYHLKNYYEVLEEKRKDLERRKEEKVRKETLKREASHTSKIVKENKTISSKDGKVNLFELLRNCKKTN